MKLFGILGKCLFWVISFACIWNYIYIIDWFSLMTLAIFPGLLILACNGFGLWLTLSLTKKKWTGMVIAGLFFCTVQVIAGYFLGGLLHYEMLDDVELPSIAYMSFFTLLVCSNFSYALTGTICRVVILYRQQHRSMVVEQSVLFST